MDVQDYFRFLLALIFVLALFGVFVVLARRYGLGPRMAARARGANKRLSLVEVMGLDAKRRLVLLRRDGMEHLIILGPHGETVVESKITPPADKTFDALLTTETGQEPH